jgi:hypothetical protein
VAAARHRLTRSPLTHPVLWAAERPAGPRPPWGWEGGGGSQGGGTARPTRSAAERRGRACELLNGSNDFKLLQFTTDYNRIQCIAMHDYILLLITAFICTETFSSWYINVPLSVHSFSSITSFITSNSTYYYTFLTTCYYISLPVTEYESGK